MQPASAPKLSADIQDDFQRLRQQTFADLRHDLRHQNHLLSLQLQERQRQTEEARRLLQQGGLDLRRLDTMDAEKERLLNRFLEQARPELLTPSPRQKGHRQAQEVRARVAQHIGQQATLLGTDLITGSPSELEPAFTTQVARDLKAIQSGSGWGCGTVENPNYPDPTVYWWYMWTPSQSGAHQFWVSAPYSGFYIARADDSWYNCKYIKVYAFYEVDVYQFYWRGADRRPVVDQRGANINRTGQVAGSLQWSFSHPLESGAPVWVQIRATLDVSAKGSGSYGELNFSDGDGTLGEPTVSIYR